MTWRTRTERRRRITTVCPRRIRRVTTERRCRTVAERLVRTAPGTDRETDEAAAGAAAGGCAGGLGSAICGKRATGIDRVGIATGGAGASTSARIAPAIIVAYGSASAIALSRANQNR
jgi:hypothetical protein